MSNCARQRLRKTSDIPRQPCSSVVSHHFDLWAWQRGVTLDSPGRANRPTTPSSTHGENARLGVETTTRSDHIARQTTKPRSSSSIDQRYSARPDRDALVQRRGPTIGGKSRQLLLRSDDGPIFGATQCAEKYLRGGRVDFETAEFSLTRILIIARTLRPSGTINMGPASAGNPTKYGEVLQ
jgi:hypothetical protein